MAPPRDVLRETRDFAATRDALRRAIAGENDPTPSGVRKLSRSRRRAMRRSH